MIDERRVDRARGALLGTFVGDALGMPFEGAPPQAIPARLEMIEARLGSGTYTDDTQMAIALAESLLECGEVEEEHLGVFDGRGSLGNGAAMRVAPVAIRYANDRGALLDAARRSARVTHAHPVGVDAAVAQAAAVGAALRGSDPLAAARATAATPELRERLASAAHLLAERALPETVAAALGNSSTGDESVPAAIYAAAAHAGFEDAVSFAVRCGGDADTIGAMAGAIAGARDGATAIPSRWRDVLENGAKGRTYVERLAERLASRA